MTKLLKAISISVCFLPTMVFANAATTKVQAQVDQGKVIVVSPRTGIQYTIDNPHNRPITIQTEAIAPANAANAERIVAANPALSEQSQQNAKQVLLNIK